MKVNALYKVIHTHSCENNLIEDQTIRLSSKKGQECPIELRRIRFVRNEDKKEIVLISNDLESPASVIMALYKQRWQIELFFKWIKQNLRIKHYLGTSENAVLIQVLVVMIAYLLLRLVKNNYPIGKLSLQDINRLISTNVFHRKPLKELLGVTLREMKPDKHQEIQQVVMLIS